MNKKMIEILEDELRAYSHKYGKEYPTFSAWVSDGSPYVWFQAHESGEIKLYEDTAYGLICLFRVVGPDNVELLGHGTDWIISNDGKIIALGRAWFDGSGPRVFRRP